MWRGMMGRVPILYLIACAAPPTSSLPEAVAMLRDAGWDVWVTATPAALDGGFLDREAVAAISGHPVRVEPRAAGEPKPMPPADAVAVVPLTVNTLAKWALLISDNTAVGILNEILGAGVQIIAGVWAKQALRDHPAFGEHVARLAGAGVRFLPHDSGYEHDPWQTLTGALALHLP